MDVFLPLKKLLNLNNPIDRLDALEANQSNTDSAIVDQVDELSARTGDLIVDNLFAPADEVEVTDPTSTSYTGHFVSGSGYTFSTIRAQIGGVLNGVLQWGANVYGQLLSASGNMIMDYRGIYLNQAHVLAQLTANSNYPATYIDDVYFGGFHVLGTSGAATGKMHFGTLSIMRYGGNVFTNGNFATGTTYSWTTTGSPTIVQDSPDGSTYAASVDNSNYVSQAVTTVSGEDYILTFYVRHVSGLDTGIIKIGANDINLLGADQTATNSWIKVVVLFRATAATTTIRAYSALATGAVWYYTNFDCQKLDTWSYVGDYDSDHLGNLELQSSRNITIEAKNANAWPPLVIVKNALTQLQQSTPANPSPTYDALYFKSDDKLYKKTSAGTETAFAEGSGTATGTNTGDVTLAGTPNYITIAGQVITRALIALTHMADVATGTIFYRKTAGTGSPEVQTLATLKTDLGLTGTNSGDQTITLTGDVTGSGTGSFAATIANAAVTLAKMANMATASVFYRKTAGSGAPEVQTLATLKTDLAVVAQTFIGGQGNATAVPLSSTAYVAPYYTGQTATRADVAWGMPVACTVKNLRINVATQPASGSLVITVMNGASTTAITVTVAAGEAGGLKSDLTHSVAFAAGDNLTIQLVNNATGVSGVIRSWSLELDIATV